MSRGCFVFLVSLNRCNLILRGKIKKEKGKNDLILFSMYFFRVLVFVLEKSLCMFVIACVFVCVGE